MTKMRPQITLQQVGKNINNATTKNRKTNTNNIFGTVHSQQSIRIKEQSAKLPSSSTKDQTHQISPPGASINLEIILVIVFRS